jgi:hypothetical protein
MPTYLSPGVYVEEVASGSRPIEGVGTSVAAFVGLAPRGALNAPTLVTNWSQYVAEFGEFTEGYYLAHSVYGFFNNGGTVCYVVRVGGAEGGLAGPGGADGRTGRGVSAGHRGVVTGAERQALTAGAPVSLGGFKVGAASGVSGQVSVEVADVPAGEGDKGADAGDRFRLVVKVDDKVAETFDVRHAGPPGEPDRAGPDRGRRRRPGRRRGGRAGVHRLLHRRLGGPHRLRRPGGDRRDHHGRRPGPDVRLSAGHHLR